MDFRLHHRFSKFDWLVFLNLKPIFYLFGIYMACFFLSIIYWNSLDHALMSSIWEKVISILAGNLNSGRSYLFTAVVILLCGVILEELGFECITRLHTGTQVGRQPKNRGHANLRTKLQKPFIRWLNFWSKLLSLHLSNKKCQNKFLHTGGL